VLFKGSIVENIAKGRSSNSTEFDLDSLEVAASKLKALKKAEKELIKNNNNNNNNDDEKNKRKNVYKAIITPAEAVVGDDNNNNDYDIEKNIKYIENVSIFNKNNNNNNNSKNMNNNNKASNIDQDIIEACIASNAHEFITEFPDHYLTDVGESNTIMVSGGQKQRIAIARALIKNPAVLLFDEATSALDTISEGIVQQSIDDLQQKSNHTQTIIIIAHRLSTIKNANKIVVVEKGRIVEVGSHDELLSINNGLYAELWNKQTGNVNK
jgi:ABC-type transport system involved in cytochrome bd biosynthesis fused ATPase/permease subunit